MQANPECHVSLAEAHALLDARMAALEAEAVPLIRAAGRVLAEDFASAADHPAADCAAWGGYALSAAATEGAGEYSPVELPASPVRPGQELPPGADAVLPLHLACPRDGVVEIASPLPAGHGVDRRGGDFSAGTVLLASGRRLRPADMALLAATGQAEVRVARQPRVAVVADAVLLPMFSALIARDGGLPAGDAAPDFRIVASGQVSGSLRVALRPGESVGLMFSDAPGVSMAVDPAACLAAYDLLASRAIRRLAGLFGTLPYAAITARLGGKIASALGVTDLVRVRLTDGVATPLGAAESGGLASVVLADGFCLVPAGSEGFSAGSPVRVYLYEGGSA